MIRRASFPIQRQDARHSGFTLIEILVVLAIAAIISSVTLGGFKEMREGNKRTSCQVNLSQIYGALRLYMRDEDNQPPPYNVNASGVHTDGIGLWALYTFADQADTTGKNIAPVDTRPIERYMRSPRLLHCPADETADHESLYLNGGVDYNPLYLSYQGRDDNTTPTDTTDDFQLYLPERGTVAGRRQLQRAISAPPADSTIVTWCPYHRASRDFDNVLFFDGSVQLLPRQQPVELVGTQMVATGGSCTTPSATCVNAAARVPKADAS